MCHGLGVLQTTRGGTMDDGGGKDEAKKRILEVLSEEEVEKASALFQTLKDKNPLKKGGFWGKKKSDGDGD